MDKYDFLRMVDDIYEECETKEQLDNRLREMTELIKQQYLLKVEFKATMEQLK